MMSSYVLKRTLSNGYLLRPIRTNSTDSTSDSTPSTTVTGTTDTTTNTACYSKT